MIRLEKRRVKTRFATATGVLVGALALMTATHAWGGSGGVGDPGGGTTPTDPTDSTTPTDGVFPLPGKHSYGDGFGAGRDHQGQDLLSKCGKQIVSAQAGRVQTIDYHGAAGNYIVIDGQGPLEDLVYMHLEERSTLRKRSFVEAGQLIGRVGDTGNASTCHLHFEIWSNPGYYEGGDAVDPFPALRAWDKRKGTNK